MYRYICKRCGARLDPGAVGATTLEELTVDQFEMAMEAFKKTPSKASEGIDPGTILQDK